MDTSGILYETIMFRKSNKDSQVDMFSDILSILQGSSHKQYSRCIKTEKETIKNWKKRLNSLSLIKKYGQIWH